MTQHPEGSRAGDPRRHPRLATRDKDPRKSLHLDEVAIPEPGPDEALVAVMASAINYNTAWTSIFEPLPTFGFLKRYGRTSPRAKRRDLPYHVVGSDLAGVVVRTGGLAELAPVKSNQLMSKPEHLTWEAAGNPGLVHSTAHRQLISRNGAGMKQGTPC